MKAILNLTNASAYQSSQNDSLIDWTAQIQADQQDKDDAEQGGTNKFVPEHPMRAAPRSTSSNLIADASSPSGNLSSALPRMADTLSGANTEESEMAKHPLVDSGHEFGNTMNKSSIYSTSNLANNRSEPQHMSGRRAITSLSWNDTDIRSQDNNQNELVHKFQELVPGLQSDPNQLGSAEVSPTQEKFLSLLSEYCDQVSENVELKEVVKGLFDEPGGKLVFVLSGVKDANIVGSSGIIPGNSGIRILPSSDTQLSSTEANLQSFLEPV